MKKERLRIDHLKKGTLLEQIWLQLFQGEITHCIFDNIQEKYQFLNVIGGIEKADAGRLYYDEQEIPESQAAEVLKNRVETISAKSNLIEAVTIDENIFLMRPRVKAHWVRNRSYKSEAAQILGEFGMEIDLEKPTEELTDFERIQTEIIKAYVMKKEVFIFTDLSSSLSSAEKKRLRSLQEELRNKGKSCVIIEPLEDMDFTCLDAISIIKRGRTCLMKTAGDCDYTMLHMALYQDERKKRAENSQFIAEAGKETGVDIRGLSSHYLTDLSLSIPRGQIVKLFCIDEKSYVETVKMWKGECDIKAGSLGIDGNEQKLGKSLSGLADRIGIVDGNPAVATLFGEMSVMDNLKLLLSEKVPGMWLISKYKRSIKLLLADIIPENIYAKAVKELSPVDIQKVVYLRWLLYSPGLLVCIQPFAEGDIKARETARSMLYMLEKRKIPILIITSNSAELNYCRGKDVYMRHGRMIDKETAGVFLSADG